ncbi:PDZ domain-containing protein, partial [Pseudomonadota bacterium]
MKEKILPIIFITFILFGCSNPYTKYYSPIMKIDDVNHSTNSTIKEPEIYINNGTNAEITNKIFDYIRNGYGITGISEFYSYYNESNNPYAALGAIIGNLARNSNLDKKVKKQGLDVGANIIIYGKKYYGENSYVTSQTTSEPTYSFVNTRGNITSNSGNTYNYTENNMVMGSQNVTKNYTNSTTTYYNYAVFLTKMKDTNIGVLVMNLSQDLKKQIKRNCGVQVAIVMNNTPAFYKNVIEGDIILEINNKPICSQEEFYQKVKGKNINLSVLRDKKIEYFK